MLKKPVLSVLFCMISTMTALPCLGDDEDSGGFFADIVSTGSGVVSGVSGAVSKVGSGIADGASIVGSGIAGVAGGVADVVSNVGSGIADGASSIVSGVGDFVSGDLVSGGLGDSFSDIWSASGDLVSMPDFFDASGDFTSSLSSGIGNLISGSDFSSMPSIQDLGNVGDFPLVGPNFGYARVLWLFSGETLSSSIVALLDGAISGIGSLSNSIGDKIKQFGK